MTAKKQTLLAIILTMMTFHVSALTKQPYVDLKESTASIKIAFQNQQAFSYSPQNRERIGRNLKITKKINYYGTSSRYQVRFDGEILPIDSENESYTYVTLPNSAGLGNLQIYQDDDLIENVDYELYALPFDLLENEDGSYSETNAYLMSVVAKYVFYEKNYFATQEEFESHFIDLMRSYGMQFISFVKDDRSSTEAVVMSNFDDIIIAFRGSESPENSGNALDYLTDIQLDLHRDDNLLGQGVSVHNGFHKSLNTVYENVLELVGRWGNKETRVWLTGESLGGALATYAAYRMTNDGIPIHGVFSYGSPRVGDMDWANAYKKLLGDRTWRMNRWHDPIADLAPEYVPIVERKDLQIMGLGMYQHVGRNVYITDSYLRPDYPYEVDYPFEFLAIVGNFVAVGIAASWDFLVIHPGYPKAMYEHLETSRLENEQLERIFHYLPQPTYPAP